MNLIDGAVEADLMIKQKAGWILLKYALRKRLIVGFDGFNYGLERTAGPP